MSDPRRWSEDAGELSGAERRLLRAGLEPSVPRSAKRAVWVALAAQLPSAVAAATTAGAGAGGLASTLGSMSLLKAAGAGVLLGATTITAATVIEHHSAARPTAPAPVRVAAPAVSARPLVAAGPRPKVSSPATLADPAPAAPLPEVGRTRSPSVAAPLAAAPLAAPSVASFPDDGASSRPDAESRKVATARSLLRAGQAQAALVALERTRHDFPNGELSQERDALTIDALRALGNTAEARRRAAAFLARYPSSPHAPIARRALE